MIKFDESTHTYTLDGKKLISVTQLMQKHGLAPSYDNVDASVLSAKAERGSLIHKEIEDYNNNGVIGFTQELINFIYYIKTNEIEVLFSEIKAYNDIVAGTCDLVLESQGKMIIADIKTTSALHKDAVSWQLSIYAYLLSDNKTSYLVDKGQAYHFDKDGHLNVVDIPLKPWQDVEDLLECERQGTIYKRDIQGSLGDLTELIQIEALISDLETQKKAAEAKAVEMRQALLAAMETNAITDYENERIKITYVAPSTRTTIDTTKLKKELPQVAEQYQKTSQVKANLRITVKEVK